MPNPHPRRQLPLEEAVVDLTMCIGLNRRSIELLIEQVGDLQRQVAELRGEPVLDLDAELANLLAGVPPPLCLRNDCPGRTGPGYDCSMAACPARLVT